MSWIVSLAVLVFGLVWRGTSGQFSALNLLSGLNTGSLDSLLGTGLADALSTLTKCDPTNPGMNQIAECGLDFYNGFSNVTSVLKCDMKDCDHYEIMTNCLDSDTLDEGCREAVPEIFNQFANTNGMSCDYNNMAKTCPDAQHLQGAPIDGEYSSWSMWTPCSATCAAGVSSRGRQCNNPPAMWGGKECIGETYQEEECPGPENCPVDGGLTDWVSLGCSDSDMSCGDEGTERWARTCSNPEPAYGGRNCSGMGDTERHNSCGASACYTACSTTQLRCDDKSTCISLVQQCDGVDNCPGGEDENEETCENITKLRAAGTNIRAGALTFIMAVLMMLLQRWK